MTITSSGLYGATLAKFFIKDAAITTAGLDSETLVKGCLVTDTYAPNFDTHATRTDITNEVSGTGYSTGGRVNASTTVTYGGTSPSVAGFLAFDHEDATWSSSTITSAMAMIDYLEGGADSADQLVCLLDFVTAVTTSNGLLTVQIASGGVFTLDYIP